MRGLGATYDLGRALQMPTFFRGVWVASVLEACGDFQQIALMRTELHHVRLAEIEHRSVKS